MARRHQPISRESARLPSGGGLSDSFEHAGVDQIKSMLINLQRLVEANSKSIAALQAQVDHLDAKVRGT